MCDSYVVKIDSNIAGISNIDNTMLNQDGTFTVTGKIYEMPEKLTINGQNVEVNEDTLGFSYNIPIKKGRNYIGIEATIDGIEYFRGNRVNYEEINIILDETLKQTEGVINTDNEIFNLSGVIQSYSSVLCIEINGDKVYTASDYLMTTKEKIFEKEFNYTIKLEKGLNTIRLVAKTSAFKTEEKVIEINYK